MNSPNYESLEEVGKQLYKALPELWKYVDISYTVKDITSFFYISKFFYISGYYSFFIYLRISQFCTIS